MIIQSHFPVTQLNLQNIIIKLILIVKFCYCELLYVKSIFTSTLSDVEILTLRHSGFEIFTGIFYSLKFAEEQK